MSMPPKCIVCGKNLESKMDVYRKRHLSCSPKPRDHKGIERDPSEPVDNDYQEDDERPTK